MRKFIFLLLFTCSLFGTKTYEIRVDGMHCPLCTAMVRKVILKVDGVMKARATLEDKKVVVEADDNVTKESLLEAIATTGYSGEFVD